MILNGHIIFAAATVIVRRNTPYGFFSWLRFGGVVDADVLGPDSLSVADAAYVPVGGAKVSENFGVNVAGLPPTTGGAFTPYPDGSNLFASVSSSAVLPHSLFFAMPW